MLNDDVVELDLVNAVDGKARASTRLLTEQARKTLSLGAGVCDCYDTGKHRFGLAVGAVELRHGE